MKKFVFVAFFALCSVGFAGNEIIIKNPEISTVEEEFQLIETTGVIEYVFNNETQVFDCQVWTSLTVLSKDGVSTRVWEGFVTHPDGYDGCGGMELTVIRLPW